LEVKEASTAYVDEPWTNGIDGDIWGWKGTDTVSTTLTPYAEETDLVAAVPKGYLLNQNHPYPFNPVTTISYQLPEESRVSIKIYNALGRKGPSLSKA